MQRGLSDRLVTSPGQQDDLDIRVDVECSLCQLETRYLRHVEVRLKYDRLVRDELIEDLRRPGKRTYIVARFLENRSIESRRQLLVVDEDESPGLRQFKSLVGGLDEIVEQ